MKINKNKFYQKNKNKIEYEVSIQNKAIISSQKIIKIYFHYLSQILSDYFNTQ